MAGGLKLFNAMILFSETDSETKEKAGQDRLDTIFPIFVGAQNMFWACFQCNKAPRGDRSAGFYIKFDRFGKIRFWDFGICGK